MSTEVNSTNEALNELKKISDLSSMENFFILFGTIYYKLVIHPNAKKMVYYLLSNLPTSVDDDYFKSLGYDSTGIYNLDKTVEWIMGYYKMYYRSASIVYKDSYFGIVNQERWLVNGFQSEVVYVRNLGENQYKCYHKYHQFDGGN